MVILGKDNCLASYLKSLRGKKISIVTAFANGTEDVIDILLKNQNAIELVVGTINSFSSPKFIDHCLDIDHEAFRLFVDFGYHNSTHWKLYLVDPDKVIIGSANLTNTGLSLLRDTCVVIEDHELHANYKKEISKLKKFGSVIDSKDSKKFGDYFDKYRSNHRRMQSGLARATHYDNVLEWLGDEANQLIPLFIWGSRYTKETVEIAHDLIDKDDDRVSRSDIRDFFTYECVQGELPYEQGDVVLCANSKGSYVDFYSFDRIISDGDINYIYSYKRKRYPRPFKLNDIKSEIKERVPKWYEYELTELGRDEIFAMITNANP
jgi:hypothetical protein